MYLSKALQFPFQGQGWFNRILILAVTQLIPVVGQLILLGYGLAVVRSIYAGQTDLPPVHWRRAFSDGLRLFIAGLLYVIPILSIIPMILTIGTSAANSNASSGDTGVFRILIVVVFALVIVPLFRQLQKRVSNLKVVISAVVTIIPIAAVVSTIATLGNLPAELSTANRNLNPVGILLSVVLALVVCFISVGWGLAGVRYAVEGTGLFNPVKIVRLMIGHRLETGLFMLTVILFGFGATLIISIGLVLLILPGLFLYTTFMLCLCVMFAHFRMSLDRT